MVTSTLRAFGVVLMALAVLYGAGLIDVGPVPPPTPVDPDIDPPGPKPIDAPGLNVLVVAHEPVSPEKASVIAQIHERVDALQGDFERFDDESSVDSAAVKWRAPFAKLRARGKDGWCVSSDLGGDYFDVPDRPEHAMEILEKYVP